MSDAPCQGRTRSTRRNNQVITFNFHLLRRLERWQTRVGVLARAWLRSLGEMEALSALAGLSFDNPEWTFPSVLCAGAKAIKARRLGHPLLAATVRVANDVTIGPPGTFLLLTGSNMSGKRTRSALSVLTLHLRKPELRSAHPP